MLRSVFYVCPICGNVVHAMGEGSFSCCGSALLPLEAEEPDDAHAFRIAGSGYIYLYCNKHGLFKLATPRRTRA